MGFGLNVSCLLPHKAIGFGLSSVHTKLFTTIIDLPIVNRYVGTPHPCTRYKNAVDATKVLWFPLQ